MKSDQSRFFLKLLSCALWSRQVENDIADDIPQWREVFRMAEEQKVSPLLFDSTEGNDIEHNEMDEGKMESFLYRRVRSEVILQASRTAEFLLLYDYLEKKDLHPLVMKGIICRNLYPQPEHRPSVDEDVLIRPEEFARYHEALTAYGLKLVKEDQDLEKADEVSYIDPESPLYIELHKYLFPPDSEAYGDLNRFFEDVYDRSVTEKIYGVVFHTLDYTDHLLFLVFHAFKHFLHSGFGIRQVCDILLFAKHYGEKIRWQELRESLESAYAFDFARAIFRIGEKYLSSDSLSKVTPDDWKTEEIDEEPLLVDIMEGGLHGASSLTRLHTSNMTLKAVEDRKKAKSRENVAVRLFHTVFLPLKNMRDQYKYLKKAPFLLPIAWGQRIVKYLINTGKNRSAADETMKTIRLGQERVKLMEEYHII